MDSSWGGLRSGVSAATVPFRLGVQNLRDHGEGGSFAIRFVAIDTGSRGTAESRHTHPFDPPLARLPAGWRGHRSEEGVLLELSHRCDGRSRATHL